MKRIFLALTASSLLGGAAFAADLPSKKEPAPTPASADGFDFAFGAKLMTDYISRGVTQSNHEPSGTVYFEPRYNIGDTQLYIGTQVWRTALPTDPFGEVDLYGGVRQTWDKFSVDVGGIYYWYPNNQNQYWTSGSAIPFAPGTTVVNPTATGTLCPGGAFCATTAKDPSFLELYFKPSYNFSDAFSLAGNLFWSPNWGNYNSGALGMRGGGFNSLYVSALPKYTFGDSGFSVSGEVGYQSLGKLRSGTIYNATGNPSFQYPSYWSWNAGVSYAWKNVTLDLRYYGSNLSKAQCYVVSSDPSGNKVGQAFTGRSGWCGDRVMASIAVDFTYGKDIKK